jgi:hypothetical protein
MSCLRKLLKTFTYCYRLIIKINKSSINDFFQTEQANKQISLDGMRLFMINVQPEDEAIYTCVARYNSILVLTRRIFNTSRVYIVLFAVIPLERRARISDWLLLVECFYENTISKYQYLVAPQVTGSAIEDIEVIEGQSMTLRCDITSNPDPVFSWTKDGYPLGKNVQVLQLNN